MTTVKPCPFCGMPPVMDATLDDPGAVFVCCSTLRGCPMSSTWLPIEKWNTRPSDIDRAALARTNSEWAQEYKRVLDDRHVISNDAEHWKHEALMAGAYIDDIKKERDAATRRAEQAEAVAKRALSRLGEWWESYDANVGCYLIVPDEYNDLKNILSAAALAGPEGGPR